MLSEISQNEKDKQCIVLLTWNLKKKPISQNGGCQGLRRGRNGEMKAKGTNFQL